MGLRGLAENLQREGLTDLEKADGIKRQIDLERKATGKPTHEVIKGVAHRLGLTRSWVDQLCQISETLDPEERESVAAGHIAAKTALQAKRFGGDEYVRTLGKQGKAATSDENIPRPSLHSVTAMSKAVQRAPAAVRDRLKQEIVSGKISDPQKADERGRWLASEKVRRVKAAPADLRAVIIGWTYKLEQWEQQMRDVRPHMDYVEEAPQIGGPHTAALKKLIETGNTLL